MKNARNLKELNLTGTQATTAGVTSLQQAIPACKIVASPAVPAASEALPKEEPSTTSRTESPLLDSDGNWKLPTGGPPPAIAPFDAAMARQHQDAWAKYLGVPVETTNSIGMKFMLIPPGEFDMGSTANEVGRLAKAAENRGLTDDFGQIYAREAPQHRVRVSKPFYLGSHEVTVEQFDRFVTETGFKTEAERSGRGGYVWLGNALVQRPEANWRSPGLPQMAQHPVTQVSWSDAVAFCRWLGRKEAADYCLPTEAEWECACRAGSTTAYSFGDDESRLSEYAWFAANSGGSTHSVGQKIANFWGLHDMHGNVWEWCADWFDARYYETSPSNDPTGPINGQTHVLRGGEWCRNMPEWARSASRGYDTLGGTALFGFRVVHVLAWPIGPQDPLPGTGTEPLEAVGEK